MRLLPLAERPGDIVPLAMQCLLQHDKKPWQLHPQAQSLLLQYPWPGNVRELENVMRRAMVLCSDHQVTPAHLMFDDWLTSCTNVPAPSPTPVMADAEAPHAVAPFMTETAQSSGFGASAPSDEASTLPINLNSAARINEHQVIMATLANTPSKTEAAKRLGISPRTLRYKLAQLREHGLGMASAAY
jgi:two-component system response regulator FlrC